MSKAPDVVTVAVSRADGGLTIVRIIENEYHPSGALTQHFDITPQYIDEIIAKYGWTGDLALTSWRIVPNDFVDDTVDRTYRNAWKDGKGNKPHHDMPKAKEIQRIFLRKQRLAEFCRLDNDYRIADEAGDTKAKTDIGAMRQKFRDVTEHPSIEAAQTVEELKALTLKALIPETQGVAYMDKMRFSTTFKPEVTEKEQLTPGFTRKVLG